MPLPIQIVADYPGPEHARWGLGTRILDIPTQGLRKIAGSAQPGLPGGPATGGGSLDTFEHPVYQSNIFNWAKWRIVYEGGHEFVERYTQRFSNRESQLDFNKRKEVTPIPAFATGAIDEIKNSIFQRLTDVSRSGGSPSYQSSIAGRDGGIDLRGGSMNWFIGHHILSELLVFGKVGVFVDSPSSYDPTLKGYNPNQHPYFYTYCAESIKNWSYTTSNGASEFAAILLKDHSYEIDPETNLPLKEVESFRLLYIGTDQLVHVRLYNADGAIEETTLSINKIPFVQFEITQSLMKNVANSQIALLNMESSDVSFTLKSNYPFYIEQHDSRNSAEYLKSAQVAYQMTNSGSPSADATTTFPISPPGTHDNANLGTAQGRKYAIGLDAPSFIHPSPEPLLASMSKQKDVKEDIRKLVHLALSTVQAKAVSAESKSIDQQGLEAGLSYIGLELENGERKLAEIWELYLNPRSPNEPATIIYPDRWSLKTTAEIQEEVTQLKTLRDDIPSATYKKEINKRIAQLSLGSHISNSIFDKINQELDAAKGASSDPKTISSDVELGILGQDTACNLRGYPPEEVSSATQDHADRLARISAAQSSGKALDKVAEAEGVAEDKALPSVSNPAARGLPDLSPSPTKDAKQEKINKPKRGPAQ